jgi:hypothetical protein
METNIIYPPLCNCLSEIVNKFTLDADLDQKSLIKAAQYFAELSAVIHSCKEANEFALLADNDVHHYINEYNALPFAEYEDKRLERLQFWKNEYQKVEKLIKGSTGKLKKIAVQYYWRFYNSRLHINLLYRVDFEKPESQKEIYLKELQRISATDFPFKNSFVSDSGINLHLFSEFTKTDRKPNFIKFASLFITDKEHENGCLYGGTAYQARHNGISELFSRCVEDNVLPQSLYTNDLKLTPTVYSCKLIAERLSVLRKSVFDPHLDKYKEVEMEAESVIRLLDSLDSVVRPAIINDVINDNSNVLLFLNGKGVTIPDKNYKDIWDDIKGKFNILLQKQYQSISRDENMQKGKSKLKFTYDNLKPIILELANLKGYQKPSVFLDELREEVEAFNSLEFKGDFYLNIHYLCKENASLFWSESHRRDITAWLRKAPIVTDVFSSTWESSAHENVDTRTKYLHVTKYLDECKEAFSSKDDYDKAVNLIDAFMSNQSMRISKAIFVKNGYIKRLAFALGQVWRNQKNEIISYEYLVFYTKAFSVFRNQRLDKKNINGMPLYKYSITKT